MADDGLVLVVEDSEDDAFLIKQAFVKANVANPLHVVRDGEEAMDYLNGIGPYSNQREFPTPVLVLLDLKMPKVDGFVLLRWIRSRTGLKSLRVVVLTSSLDQVDTGLAYQLGTNSVISKPLAFQQLVTISQAISSYWLSTDRAPRAARPTDWG